METHSLITIKVISSQNQSSSFLSSSVLILINQMFNWLLLIINNLIYNINEIHVLNSSINQTMIKQIIWNTNKNYKPVDNMKTILRFLGQSCVLVQMMNF